MINLDKDGDVWTITLNRPDKANALTGAMLDQLCDIVENAAAAKVLILTGSGKVFSAGADLDAARAGLATSPLWERLSGAIAAHQGLTIAALNGTVAGGAMGMVLACDVRIAVDGAKFFYPVMKLGFLPQPSDPMRLRALIGPSRAKMILMCGIKIQTEQALAWGLIDHITDAAHLYDVAAQLARDVRAATASHISGIKALI
uniref:enoyl-CoA hydratase/isomerase family protein n=1 Tax=Yoonia sp. TaxID=2212373 RepID=UPI0040472053